MIPGYVIEKKGGSRGILALVSSSLTKEKLKPRKHFKKFELIAFEVRTGANNMVILQCENWKSYKFLRDGQPRLRLPITHDKQK